MEVFKMQNKFKRHPYRSLFSDHAWLRLAQRNLSVEDVWFVIDHGVPINRAGRTIFFLGKGNIPSDLRSENQYARLEGTVVVTSSDNHSVITVYRNRQTGYRDIRSEETYYRMPRRPQPLPVHGR
jgi:hypothetical protein